MKLSARNQLPGKITAIQEGAVNAIVSLDVAGTTVTGTISMSAVKDLGLKVGMDPLPRAHRPSGSCTGRGEIPQKLNVPIQ